MDIMKQTNKQNINARGIKSDIHNDHLYGINCTPTKKVWYLVYTKTNQEKYAKTNLLRQNYQIYLPLFNHKKRFRGQYRNFVEPLFPRYLFIQLNTNDDNWAPIRSTYGVQNIVYFGLQPAAVSDQIIASLKSQEADNGVFYLPDQEFNAGDSVRIAEGFMNGLEGVLLAKNSKERVQVLLQYIGKELEVTVSVNKIEKIL